MDEEHPRERRQREHPHDRNDMGERQDQEGHVLEQLRQERKREERSREERHRGDEEECRVIERVDPGRYRRKTHPETRKQQPPKECERDGKQRGGERDDPERCKDREHDRDIHDRAGGSPEDLPCDNVLYRERGCDHGIEALLVIHPDIGTVRALEERGVHHGNRENCGCNVVHIGNSVDDANVGPDPETDGKEVEEGLDERGKEVHFPGPDKDPEVPLPDPDGTPGDPWQGEDGYCVHS
eukprot:TRINITY_DN15031_c0_g1_i1.p4 TRINITY_DN15031_c0_g1~~TRINITY_DN15031_c0_g1_i1.p4  ORF type:complete len:240 (-),score=-20.34 TRINITY_DN15031_c0_g1_i1:833-1552(-)